ncbi:MAG TPA: AraC family transcriptional regulator [Paraburkholderia sp.]|jgi:AraC-like DNA-binding protein|nr:AraC family transcriptional regulator [Paraburkholderia sp.]
MNAPATRPTSRQTEVRIWRAPDLGAELLRGQFHDFSYDVHTHETACFALITEGAIRIRMRGAEFVARQGDLYAIDADEPHAGWPVDDLGWRQRTVYVDTEHLRSRLRDGGAPRRGLLKGPIIGDPVLTSLFYGVHRCSEAGDEGLQRDEQYLSFAARLFERHVSGAAPRDVSGREPRAVALAKDFLDQHVDRNVHLDDIASAAGLPPYRLFRAFGRHVGMTPHAYQRQARIRRALALIRAGRALSDVAAAVGFADQAHLTRWFRRSFAVTPGMYRKALLA